jgi:hypothetical protein
VGFAVGCWCDDYSTCGWGSNVGVGVGQRSWMVDALGLDKAGWLSMHLGGSITCWRKGLRVALLLWFLACIVMLSAMLLSLLSRA